MNIKENFTEALILEQIKQDADLQRGYTVKSTGKTYNDYLCKSTSWKQLISSMDSEHIAQYQNGSGGELEEKDGRPPKMAAFASSSRMIYNPVHSKEKD